MFATSQAGPVTIFRMGRSIGNFVFYHVHSFLIGETLIDTGAACVRNEMLNALTNRKISRIINTHYHEDHTGNNYYVQNLFGVSIYAHPDTLPILENPKRLGQLRYSKLVWGCPRPCVYGTTMMVVPDTTTRYACET